MKKLSLLILMSAMIFAGCSDKNDDNPDDKGTDLTVSSVAKENHSFVVKFSGTNCPPCGGWGWTMSNDLQFGIGDAGGYSVCYGQNFVAQLFITPEATTLQNEWGATGYPHFGANGSVTTVDRSQGVYTQLEKQEIFDRVNNHAAAAVVANTGLNYTIADGKIQMKWKTKAFDAVSNAFLAVYIIEDEVEGYQAGHPDGIVDHHLVMRKEVTAGEGYGSSLGSLTANQEIDGEATIDVDEDWNPENISIYAVVYSKVGTKYNFVNLGMGNKK
jgi:hypothetical protein